MEKVGHFDTILHVGCTGRKVGCTSCFVGCIWLGKTNIMLTESAENFPRFYSQLAVASHQALWYNRDRKMYFFHKDLFYFTRFITIICSMFGIMRMTYPRLN